MEANLHKEHTVGNLPLFLNNLIVLLHSYLTILHMNGRRESKDNNTREAVKVYTLYKTHYKILNTYKVTPVMYC